MGATYVDVPRDRMLTMLAEAGFSPHPAHGSEIVYARAHALDPRLTVFVYTSIAQQASEARACGQDAIRVVALFRWLRRGETEPRRKKLYSARVYRVTSVEGVLERTLINMRKAYQACNEFRKLDNARHDHRAASIVAGEDHPNNRR